MQLERSDQFKSMYTHINVCACTYTHMYKGIHIRMYTLHIYILHSIPSDSTSQAILTACKDAERWVQNELPEILRERMVAHF